jgi:hypothetical protein
MSSIQAITYEQAYAITPSDTVNDANGPFAAIQVGTGGTLKVITKAGQTVTLTMATGTTLPLLVARIFATGTSATNLVGLCAPPWRQGNP